MLCGLAVPGPARFEERVRPAAQGGERLRVAAEKEDVTLDADPLVDIRNTRRIQAVMLNGRLLDRKALDEIQSRLEAAAPNQ